MVQIISRQRGKEDESHTATCGKKSIRSNYREYLINNYASDGVSRMRMQVTEASPGVSWCSEPVRETGDCESGVSGVRLIAPGWMFHSKMVVVQKLGVLCENEGENLWKFLT